MFRFRNFRTRLTVFFLGLLLAVQIAAFFAVDLVNNRNARQQINTNLEVDARVFSLLLAGRQTRLLQAARLLSADFAFKSAFASGDAGTLLSALHNHQARIDSEIMMLFSLEDDVIVSTLQTPIADAAGRFSHIFDAAENSDDGEAANVMMLAGRPYQVVLVPLMAPLPVARIAIGFVLDGDFVRALKDLTLADVSLVRRTESAWRIEASTLADPAALAATLGEPRPPGQSFLLTLAGQDTVSLMQPVGENGNLQIVLQRPLAAALEPYRRLRIALLTLTAVAFVFSLVGASVIARSVTKPVQTLAAATRRVQTGDYTNQVTIDQSDELGELALAFNRMTRGLAERDRVRDMLGKVVDPSVAEKLLSKDLELGGEEREVSVLFSDIRGFTSLGEKWRPAELLDLLNRYLTSMSAAIEAEGGVVDKYIGDAIMALFGAPLAHENDATRAVRAALSMDRALASLNNTLVFQGFPKIEAGIGISTGLVVAGNMGSIRRLNYTVIGDTVNLASRIEGLTRYYGVPLIVSESTAKAAPEFIYRELDIVRVKGKQEPVKILEPLEPDCAIRDEIKQFHQALAHYRLKRWQQAEDILTELTRTAPQTSIYSLYLKRIATHRRQPPLETWDAIETFNDKGG